MKIKLTRKKLRKIIAEATYLGGKEPPSVYRANRMLDKKNYRGTEYSGIGDPYDYVDYDEDGDEILSQVGEELLAFKSLLDNVDHFRHNKKEMLENEAFMTKLANDLIDGIENLPNIPNVPKVEREALGHYLASVFADIPPKFITAGASAGTSGEVPHKYR